MKKGKIQEIPFKISDELNNNTSLGIVLLLYRCSFSNLIKEVRIEKAHGKKGIHLKIIWKRADRKPIFIIDDIIHDDAERLLYELKLICNKETTTI